jgi:hypothetical protein
MKYLV